jgi:hypothetical protein
LGSKQLKTLGVIFVILTLVDEVGL